MKLITLENAKELQPYIEQANYNEYNSNIITMLIWQNYYHIEFETYDHFALVRWITDEGAFWMMPLCTVEYRKEAMDHMLAYSKQKKEPFYMASIIEEFRTWMISTYPDQYLYEDFFDAQDYVYKAEQNRTLSGKKMQKRRNHYNAFIKEYEGRFQYVPLTSDIVPEVYEFLDEWEKQKGDAQTLQAERMGIHLLLDHLEEFPIRGGCIYIDGKVEAFLIASPLSKDTLEIHVEKANREIRGLYVAILKHFLMDQDEEIAYINREDDMGLEYLRKAKTNMHPCCKIKKYGVEERHITIVKAEDEDRDAIMSLWQQSFAEETQSSTDFYFHHLYRKEDTFLIKQGSTLLCMLQTRKINIMLNGREETVSFIVGVATHPSYRRNGLMKRLLTHVLDQLKQKESCTLLQAYDWDLYKPFGFEVMYHKAKVKADRRALAELESIGSLKVCENAEVLLALYKQFVKSKNGYRIRDRSYYEDYLIPYIKQDHGILYVYYDTKDQPAGYLIAYEEETILVTEIIYLKEEDVVQMIRFLDQTKSIIVFGDEKLPLTGKMELLPSMMMKAYQEMEVKEPLYISEVL